MLCRLPALSRCQPQTFAVRLIALQTARSVTVPTADLCFDWIIDRRQQNDLPLKFTQTAIEDAIQLTTCPASWNELSGWLQQAQQTRRALILAYPPPSENAPIEFWRQLVGIAKYLSRTGNSASQQQLCQQLNLGNRSLQIGLYLLQRSGFEIRRSNEELSFVWQAEESGLSETDAGSIVEIQPFLDAVQEEQFQRQYFAQVPLSLIQAIATRSNFAGVDSLLV